MLRITTSESVEAAESYFRKSLTKGDYYMDGQEVAGSWGGKGAELLGLSGDIGKDDFVQLLHNRRPDGERLTARDASNRRPGYDFTFDVPKSVSLLHAIRGDDRIEGAMSRAIQTTMQEMEKEMHARVRKNGAFHDRLTGNMIWADFTHYTTRPAQEGNRLAKGIPDPHLHTHVYVMNATYDKVEDIWKAGEFSRIKRDAPYYQAMYHTHLAGELQKLGFGIIPTKNAFELEGIDRQLIERFSRRTVEIDDMAEQLQISNAHAKAELGAKIRERKNDDLSLSFLKECWTDALSTSEAKAIKSVARNAAWHKGKSLIVSKEAAREAVAGALEHELERVSEVSERRLVATALARSVGKADVETVWEAYEEQDGIIRAEIDGEMRLSTREILAEENTLFDLVRSGRGSIKPLVDDGYSFKTPLFLDKTKDTSEQQLAVRHVFESKDWVVGIVGRAGTGKTTLLQEVSEGVKATHRRVVLCAPTSEAARGVLHKEGFKDAETVQKLLTDDRLQGKLKGSVLWVDEAGMIGTHDLLRLLFIAKDKGASKVVLSGDCRQIRSVPRGDAFRLLEENGLAVARLDNVMRQKNPVLKKAVEAVSRGAIGKGFDLLDKANAIQEIGDEQERHQALAKAYVKASLGRKPTKGLVISPTHAEGDKVTKAIRSEYKSQGYLKGTERLYQTDMPTGWTESEKTIASNYEIGQTVQFQRNARLFKIGERLKVIGVDAKNNIVIARRENEVPVNLPLKQAGRFSVYWPKELPLMKNDAIRITKNTYKNRKTDLVNGSVYTVEGFKTNGDIKLRGGKVLPKTFTHMKHSYCITADSAQAKTVDRVYLAVGDDSMGATDMRRYYVALSRSKHEAHIFTSDKQALLKAARRDNLRRSATEIAAREGKQAHAMRISNDLAYNGIHLAYTKGYNEQQPRQEKEHDRPPTKEQTPEISINQQWARKVQERERSRTKGQERIISISMSR